MTQQAKMHTPSLDAEQMASLRRAFIDNRADFITIDGWTNDWLRRCASEAEGAGYLKSSEHEGDQYTAIIYRLTKRGRAALSPPQSPNTKGE